MYVRDFWGVAKENRNQLRIYGFSYPIQNVVHTGNFLYDIDIRVHVLQLHELHMHIVLKFTCIRKIRNSGTFRLSVVQKTERVKTCLTRSLIKLLRLEEPPVVVQGKGDTPSGLVTVLKSCKILIFKKKM